MGHESNFAFTGVFDFTLLSRELIIPISSIYSDRLTDINFLFYFSPTVNLPDLCPPEFTGVQDLRLYVNLEDVSDALKTALNARMAELSAAEVKEAYLKGVNAYLNTLLSLQRKVNETSGDKAFAERYANSGHWSTAFAKLGDASMGWSGNLHPINFIFNYINIRPLSIRELMKDKAAPIRSIAFSQGGASFAGRFRAILPAGRIYYQCEVVFRNPLDDVLEQVAQSIESIDKKMSLVRTQYLEPATERLARIEGDVATSTSATAATVEQLAETIRNIHP